MRRRLAMFPAACAAAIALGGAPAAVAQVFDLDWRTLDGGGGMSWNGPRRVTGTIGQPDAGRLGSGGLALRGGYRRGGATSASVATPSEPGPAAPAARPLALHLHGAWPNPFAARTLVAFELPADGPARLEVFDLDGRLVRTLVSGRLTAGRHSLAWDARDERGAPAAAGVYLARLSAAAGTAERKLLVAR